jgi:hypothetical protein
VTISLLTWGIDGGLVTLQMTDGTNFVLLHEDPKLAGRQAELMSNAGQRPTIIELNNTAAEVIEMSEKSLNPAPGELVWVLPSDPTYVELMNMLVQVNRQSGTT